VNVALKGDVGPVPRGPTSGVNLRVIDTEELFRSHARYVADFLARLGIPPRDIDDLVQETFLVVHRKGGFVQEDAKPTTYLAAIAVRIASTARRTQARRRLANEPGAIDGMASCDPSPHESADAHQSLERVAKALDALDMEKRAVFVLFEINGEPCDEIARALEVPLGTVHSRLHAARAAFKKAHARLTKGEDR
jgi:RNA polymerase sigma-70 factor (ECF subfamily)